MITYTIVIEQLDERRCTIQFNTKRDNETQAELQDASILAEKLRQASDEITQRYAAMGGVSVLDGLSPESIDEMKDEIRREGEEGQGYDRR